MATVFIIHDDTKPLDEELEDAQVRGVVSIIRYIARNLGRGGKGRVNTLTDLHTVDPIPVLWPLHAYSTHALLKLGPQSLGLDRGSPLLHFPAW